jgi:hypothetical protein
VRPAATPSAKEQYPAPPTASHPQAQHNRLPSYDGGASATGSSGYPDEKAQPVESTAPIQMVSGAPPPEHFVGATATSDDVGTFNGGSYRISHRDSNSILTVQLAKGCPFETRPGSLVSMSPSITLKGQWKFSFKKVVSGSDIGTSTLIGPGEAILGPPMLGDVTVLRLSGNEVWSVGHDAYLGSTQGVIKDYKRQGLGKAIFSGEGLWVYKISGTGLLWLTSFGAIIRKDVSF